MPDTLRVKLNVRKLVAKINGQHRLIASSPIGDGQKEGSTNACIASSSTGILLGVFDLLVHLEELDSIVGRIHLHSAGWNTGYHRPRPEYDRLVHEDRKPAPRGRYVERGPDRN